MTGSITVSDRGWNRYTSVLSHSRDTRIPQNFMILICVYMLSICSCPFPLVAVVLFHLCPTVFSFWRPPAADLWISLLLPLNFNTSTGKPLTWPAGSLLVFSVINGILINLKPAKAARTLITSGLVHVCSLKESRCSSKDFTEGEAVWCRWCVFVHMHYSPDCSEFSDSIASSVNLFLQKCFM